MTKLRAAFALTVVSLWLDATAVIALAAFAWRSPLDGSEWAFLLPASLLAAGGVLLASLLAKEA